MPSLIKPKRLRKGDTIAVLAPAGPVDPARLEAGVAALRNEGYEVSVTDEVLARDRYFAGTAERRACQFNSTLRRDDVAAILCARGGYGSNYLLERIAYGDLRRLPKIVGGYSDFTCILTYAHERAGIPMFHAPLVAGDWSRENGVDLASWHTVLEGGLHTYNAPVTLREGEAEGKFYGGCLALLAASIGTPFAPRLDNTVLFIEDVNEPPYKIDRMLRQLELAGALRSVRGIVFGVMEKCGDNVAQDIAAMLHWFRAPIAFGLVSGHVTGANETLAFGVQVRLTANASAATIEMLETAVE